MLNTFENRRKFAESLKPGDEIRYIENYGLGGRNISSIVFERRTATQLVFEQGRVRFNRETLRQIGGHRIGWLPDPATAEQMLEVEKERRQSSLASELGQRTKFRDLELETLEAINALVVTSKEEGRSPLLQSLRKAVELLAEYRKELGGCDHSVGICYCADNAVLKSAQDALKKLEGGESC